MGEEGGAAAFDGMIKGWPQKALKISNYSSNSKNNFIIEVAAKLYQNYDWSNTTKTEDIIAKECVKRASTLCNLLSDMFD